MRTLTCMLMSAPGVGFAQHCLWPPLGLCRRLQGNPGLTCPDFKSTTSYWLSTIEFVCSNSPYLNLDAMVLRQRLLDAGTPAASLTSAAGVTVRTGLPNTGGSFTLQAQAGAIKGVAVGTFVTLDSQPAINRMHAMFPSKASIAWAGSSGATFCIVAKLPATATGDQVLFDFSPVFAMARSGTGADLLFTAGTAKVLAKAALDGKWRSYIAIVTATGSKIFVNGALKGSVAHNSLAQKAATEHYFGAPLKTPAAMLSGSVRQVMAWQRALDEKTELPLLQAQLAAKWKLPAK
jgi:hypothetical protein